MASCVHFSDKARGLLENVHFAGIIFITDSEGEILLHIFWKICQKLICIQCVVVLTSFATDMMNHHYK